MSQVWNSSPYRIRPGEMVVRRGAALASNSYILRGLTVAMIRTAGRQGAPVALAWDGHALVTSHVGGRASLDYVALTDTVVSFGADLESSARDEMERMLEEASFRLWASSLAVLARTLGQLATWAAESEGQDGSVQLPLTQAQLALACGLSRRHQCMHLRSLEEANLMMTGHGRMQLLHAPSWRTLMGIDLRHQAWAFESVEELSAALAEHEGSHGRLGPG